MDWIFDASAGALATPVAKKNRMLTLLSLGGCGMQIYAMYWYVAKVLICCEKSSQPKAPIGSNHVSIAHWEGV